MSTIVAHVSPNAILYRRRRNALGSGTSMLIAGIIFLVVWRVNSNNYPYYGYNYSGWQIAGIVFIVCSAVFYTYAIILHRRLANSNLPDNACVVVTQNPNAAALNYQSQPLQLPPGAVYPVGAYPPPPPQNANFQPGPGYSQYPQNYPQDAYGGPVEPPPPYSEPKRF